jgi:protein involved in polysaccharide export with SLBB domain
VNFVKARVRIRCVYRTQNIFYFILTLYLSLFLSGCSDKVLLPSAEQLVEFENAALPQPVVDLDRLVKAKIGGGPYHVLSGDVLELTMPYILQVVVTDESVGGDKNTVYICRVSDGGTITLPIVGQIDVDGKTLAQIESAIIDAYYPKYALTVPSVLARVLEYKTAKVSISGAVQKPGIYSLRSDQMSLIALIMEAGGIIDEGAAVIRIVRSENAIKPDSENAPGNLTDQKVGQVTKSVNTERIESPTFDPDINDTKVQLSFKQLSAQSTTGIISITYDEKVLLTEQMDISSEIERLVLLKQLSWREPQVSTSEVERKLCALEESLRTGSGISRIEKGNTNEYVNSLMSVGKGRDESRILHEKNVEWDTKVLTIDETQRPSTVPELYKPSYGVTYDTNGKKMYSNIGFNTGDPKDNTTTCKAINEELNEILYMVTKKKNGGKNTTNKFQKPESIILPVKGYNIPFADVVLKDGDNVIVERLTQPLFSVIGLVNRPGNFPYPPNVHYNLMQALAFAGGLDPTAEPHYATVYRLKPDGSIIHATFEVIKTGNSSQLTDALNIRIKPGDIVSVEHTPRTRTNVFLDRTFRINLGTYYSLNDAWN